MEKPLTKAQISGIAATLSQCDLFTTLTTEQLFQIAAMSQIVTYQKGDLIATAGEHLKATYVVQSGTVKVTTSAPTPNQAISAVFKAGMCFGLMSVVPGKSALVNSEAASPVKLIYIPREPFLNLYKAIPTLPMNVSATLTEHLRHLIVYAQMQKGRSIEARLAGWILDQPAPFVENIQEVSEDGKPCTGVITMDINKNALAHTLGVTQPTLSRALAQMRQSGLASSKGKHIYIFNRPGIEDCTLANDKDKALPLPAE